MQIEGILTIRTHGGMTTAFGLFVVLSPEEIAGPSWEKALSGSGPGRFRGLANFFFAVFPPSHLPHAAAPRSASGQSLRIALFSSKNSDCKIHFKEENPMQRIRKTDGVRGNTPVARNKKTILKNTPMADSPSLSVARKRAGFLGWSRRSIPTPIDRASATEEGGPGKNPRNATRFRRIDD
jgi:hypothetical protein